MDKVELNALKNLKMFTILLLIAVILAFIPIISVAAAFVGIVSFIMLILAFKSFSKIDKQFATPYIFCLIYIVGFVLLIASMLSILGFSILSLGFSAALTLTNVALFAGEFVALIIVSVILMFLGAIIGVILGLFRVGKRYKNSLVSTGAILLIIPLVDIVGIILLLVGLLQITKNVSI
ncbi:MAG: DUF973 family protein [Candidatus Acidifodinimicrobium sp.]